MQQGAWRVLRIMQGSCTATPPLLNSTSRRHRLRQALAHLLAPLHSERSSAATRPPLEGVTSVPEIAAAPSSRLCVWGGRGLGVGVTTAAAAAAAAATATTTATTTTYLVPEVLRVVEGLARREHSLQALGLAEGAAGRGVVGAWQVHGKCTVGAWQVHGTCMVGAW